MPRLSTLSLQLLVASLLPTALFFTPAAMATAPNTSTTELSVTAGGQAITASTVGTVITLTATVAMGPETEVIAGPIAAGSSLNTAHPLVAPSPITAGLVNFCDGTPCTGVHFLGSVEITVNGTGILRLRPSIGAKNYYATFTGTAAFQPSTSSTAAITVTGAPTTTAISQTGTASGYSLTATVVGSGSAITPTGQVSFLNTSNANAVLGTANLATTGTVKQTFTQNTYDLLSPKQMVIADFNGDGIPDIAATNTGNASLSISIGNGDGTFKTAVYYDISAGGGLTGKTFGLASGDFNRDGNLDLVMTGNGDAGDGLYIYLNNGNHTGTFANPAFIAQSGGVDSVAVGDFNGDGIQDLAVTSDMSNQVQIYIGTPSGTFTSGNTLTTDNGPSGIVAADINGDGLLDLVVATEVSGTLDVYLGNGDDSLNARQTYTTAGTTYSPFLADLNNDGALDMVAVSQTGEDVYVFLNQNNGHGTFNAPVTYPLGGSAAYAVASDINGDGIPDLIASSQGANTISVLPGVGDGTFGTATTYTVGSEPGYMAAADLNGDGVPDIVTPSTATNTLTILTNNLTSTTTATATGITVTGPPTTYTVEASYPGDTYYLPSASTTTLTAASPTITLQPPTLPSGIVYVAYSATTITATGGTAPYSFAITTGALPAGLSLTSAGILSGTPTTSGMFPITVKGTDANGYTGTINYIITVAPPTITVAPIALPNGHFGVTYSQLITASGGLGPYTFTVTGTLPSGLTLSTAGVLSGTPTASGSFSFTVMATDSSATPGPYSGSASYTVTIAPADFTFSLIGPAGYSAVPGSVATYSFALAPLFVVYGGTVTFTVANLPSGATATFTPNTVATNAGAATMTMSVQTPAAVAYNGKSPKTTTLFCLLFMPLLFIKRKTRSLRSIKAWLLLLTIAGITASLSSCNNTNGFLLQEVQDHTLTVTASNGTTQHSQQVLLVIQ